MLILQIQINIQIIMIEINNDQPHCRSPNVEEFLQLVKLDLACWCHSIRRDCQCAGSLLIACSTETLDRSRTSCAPRSGPARADAERSRALDLRYHLVTESKEIINQIIYLDLNSLQNTNNYEDIFTLKVASF